MEGKLIDPYISQITIEGFKCFHKKQTLRFALGNSKVGSGLTLIVGENNSGKSSIIEALKLVYKNGRANKELKPSHKKTNIWVKTEEIYDDRHNKATIHVSVDKNKFPKIKRFGELENVGEFPVGCHVHLISTKRDWKSKLGSWEEYGENSTRKDDAEYLIGGLQYKWDFGYDINKFLEEDFGLAILAAYLSRKDEVTQLMRKFVPFYDWSIEKKKQNKYGDYWTPTNENENAHVYYHIGPDKKIDFDYVGDGMRSLFQIIVSITVLDSFLIVIDEPELYLSPIVQRKLHAVLAEKSKEKPIALITHSPYFVDWEYLRNGASLVRVSQSAGRAYIKTLTRKTVDQLLRIKAQKWDHPFLLSTTAKEIFFERNIVFVEGQKDKAVLEQFIIDNNLQINFAIFGYGSGGAGNIAHFLTLAREIGINAGALFDSDTEGLDAYRECCRKFGRTFKLVRSGKKDIMDEPGKFGFFRTKNGLAVINPEAKGSLIRILENFNKYFDKKDRSKDKISG